MGNKINSLTEIRNLTIGPLLSKTVYLVFVLSLFKTHLVFADSIPNFYISYSIKGEPRNIVAQKVLTKIYQELGFRAVFNYIPARRSLMSTNDGLTDAEIFRIDGLSKEYPNLIRIKTPLFSVEHNIATLESEGSRQFEIEQYDDLKLLTLGFFRGHKYAEKIIENPAINVSPVGAPDNEKLFGMLIKGRVDGVVTTQAMIDEAKHLYPNMKVKLHKIRLPTSNLYHYVNKKHENLAFALNKQIKKYQKQGKLEALLKEANLTSNR